MHRYMHTCMHACHTFQPPQQQLAHAGTRWAKLRNMDGGTRSTHRGTRSTRRGSLSTHTGTRWAKLRNTGDLVRAATDRVRGEYLVEYLMDEGEVR